MRKTRVVKSLPPIARLAGCSLASLPDSCGPWMLVEEETLENRGGYQMHSTKLIAIVHALPLGPEVRAVLHLNKEDAEDCEFLEAHYNPAGQLLLAVPCTRQRAQEQGLL